jgi:hypothetical protein
MNNLNRRMGLEGIVSKRTDAPYRGGPSKMWLKSKNPTSEAVRRERETSALYRSNIRHIRFCRIDPVMDVRMAFRLRNSKFPPIRSRETALCDCGQRHAVPIKPSLRR